MYSICSFLVIALSIAYSTNAANAPFIKKCKPDDSKCLKESTQFAISVFAKGIPELGVQQLDPFQMKSLDASSPGLKLLLWDISGTGLKDCIAKKVQRDVIKSKLFIKLECSVDFVGKYEMKGQLLILPIEGKGDAHVNLNKLIIQAELDMDDKVGKDGNNYWTIKSWKHSYDVKGKSEIDLQNLFNGNEVLSRAVRELISSSSKEIIYEIGPPIVKAIVAKIIENIQRFLEHVSTSELTL